MFYTKSAPLKFFAAFLLIIGSVFVIAYGFYILYIYDDHPELRAKKDALSTVSKFLTHLLRHKFKFLAMGILTIIVGLGCLLLSAINAYFVEIFLRDYLFLKNRNAARNSLPLTTHEFSKYL
jgi:hypothetical protein